jgi:hypothetical protein
MHSKPVSFCYVFMFLFSSRIVSKSVSYCRLLLLLVAAISSVGLLGLDAAVLTVPLQITLGVDNNTKPDVFS